MELTEAQHAEIRQAVADFKRGMDIRSSLNLRIAKRITWILRTGSVSMGVITVIMVFALMAFNNKLVEMNNVLDTMNQKFGSMSADMGNIQVILRQMDRNVSHLPGIVGETSAMKDMMKVMRSDISAVSNSVANLQGTLTGITENVDHMTHTFRGLDHTMRYIDADLNKISGPSRMLNKTMPFLP